MTDLARELCNSWNLSELILIGKYSYQEGNNFGFFVDIKNKDGENCSYPNRLGQVNVYIANSRNYNLKSDTYYQFYAEISTNEAEKERRGNPYLLQVDTTKIIAQFNEPRELVEARFKEAGATPSDAEDLANAIEKISVDLYTETERFIFELIQNADDIPNRYGTVDIKFVILNQYFLFLHNGRPFKNDEVIAVSKIGSSTKKANQTGYKGIGFKSVFRDSKCVYIHSGHFSFRYDNSYREYENSDKIPWQLKPIWTESSEYPQEIQQYKDFFKSPVAIALKVSSEKIEGGTGEEGYRAKIANFLAEPRFMLFLRHVNLIEVAGLRRDLQDLKVSISIDREEDYCQIARNRNVVSQWVIAHFPFSVPLDVQKETKTRENVPDKLRELEYSKLSFAAQIKDGKLISIPRESSILFTYLPTNVNEYQFPFIVNADFLTTASRQGIIKDHFWNTFIFEKIAYLVFKWIADLGKDERYKNYITSVIPQKFHSTGQIELAFNKGFDAAIAEIAFIPSDESDVLLKVSESIIDETGITEVLSPEHIREALSIHNKYFVNRNIEKQSKLKQINVDLFDINKLGQFLKSRYFQNIINPTLNVEIIKHLQSKGYEQNLATIPFLLDENENLKEANSGSLYFPPTDKTDRVLLTFDTFYFIHSEIHLEAQNNPDFKKWLKKLGVKEFNGAEIVKERIKKGKYSPQNPPNPTFENYINLARFIFKYRVYLNDTERLQLSNLLVLYKKGEQYYPASAKSCYLSDAYKPLYPLEKISILVGLEMKFITSHYCEGEADINNWKRFFNSLRVPEPDALGIVRHNIFPLIEQGNINERNTINITKFIFDVYQSAKFTDDDVIKLKNLPLLTVSNGLQKVKDCYLSEHYSPNLMQEPIADIPLVNLISSTYQQSSENTAVEWKEFFLSIGVNELRGIELVRERINQIKANPELVTASNAVEIGRYIFKLRNDLTETDFSNLANLKLLLKNGDLEIAEDCYFANEYNPEHHLEGWFDSTDFRNFVSPAYIDNKTEIEEWKKFFNKIGVWEKPRVIIGLIEFEIKSQLYSYLFEYMNFISISLNASIYKFQNFICFEYWQYFENPNFSINMWNYLANNWNSLDLTRKSIVRFNSSQTRQVTSFFEFSVTQNPSIPCTDGKCYKPSEVYSKHLENLIGRRKNHLHVCSLGFSSEIENFLGINRRLDVFGCLVILNLITTTQPLDKHRLNTVYEHLYYCITSRLQANEIALISQWKTTGKLLACDDEFHLVSELFYLDPNLDLPHKRNRHIVKLPEISNSRFDFEKILSALKVRKICFSDMTLREEPETEISHSELPNLINQRAIYLGLFLDDSNFHNITSAIVSKVENIRFYQRSKLYRAYDQIGYSESINNYYEKSKNAIYFVGKWNGRKNVKIGNYLVEALGETLVSGRNSITSERLLDFLDDPISEVIAYLKEIGRTIPDNILETGNKIDSLDNNSFPSTVREQNYSGNVIVQHPKEGNPETGKVGEYWAEQFYKNYLGYSRVEKQPDYVGYDFACHAETGKPELKVEVKTRKSNYPVVGISANEWSKLINPDNRDCYELLIVIHNGISDSLSEHEWYAPERIDNIIRVKSAWSTLGQILFAAPQYLGQGEYTKGQFQGGETQIQSLIGLELKSNVPQNNIILNWQKLLADVSTNSVENILLNWRRLLGSKSHPNIELYRPQSRESFNKL